MEIIFESAKEKHYFCRKINAMIFDEETYRDILEIKKKSAYQSNIIFILVCIIFALQVLIFILTSKMLTVLELALKQLS